MAQRGRPPRPERWLTAHTLTVQFARTPKAVHLRMPGAFAGETLSLCGRHSAALTADRAQVTCGVCLRAKTGGAR